MKFAETTQEVMVAKASNLPLQYPHRFDSRETFPKSLQGIIDLTSLGAFGPPLPTVYVSKLTLFQLILIVNLITAKKCR